MISSGLKDPALERVCAVNGWSYLFTKRNCVPLVMNIAISIHEKAEFIYKIDEDIFITKHCFEMTLKTFEKVSRDSHYTVGFVAPLIPVNTYGHIRIPKKTGMTGIYNRMFEPVKYAPVTGRMLGNVPETAKFFWGEGGFIPSIDYMDEEFYHQDFEYSVCPVLFNIGFILIHRSVLALMGGWSVPDEGSGMGMDEQQLCSFCVIASMSMIVAENTVAGHLSFGRQNDAMKEYYLTHRDRFRCPE